MRLIPYVLLLASSLIYAADWWSMGGQSTWIMQQSTPNLGKNNTFDPNFSFGPEASFGWSGTITLSGSIMPWRGAQLTLEPEYANAHGMPNSTGIAGYPNGEFVRTSVFGGNPPPYIARAYFKQEFDLAAQTQLTMSIGKFAANDFFDVSQVASNPRRRFLSWALMEQGAWDYAADTRGYTCGVVAELNRPNFAIRAGIALMPTVANGPSLSWDLLSTRSEILEGEIRYDVLGKPGLVKVLGYLNHADMGNYERAILTAAATNTLPDITSTRQPSSLKMGIGLLAEQDIHDDIRAFLRAGFNDGQNETFAFTEIDRSISIGAHTKGSYWKRPNDRLALAIAISGLSDPHARYLAAGGKGFQLGDRMLQYGWETIIETYYLVAVMDHIEISGDIQTIFNPGMNAAHGPTGIFSLRISGDF